MVDKQAKTSLSLEPTSFKIPFSNFKPSIGEHQSVVRNIRKEVVSARLRLGHTRVTHNAYHKVKMHHSLNVTSFWSVAILHR